MYFCRPIIDQSEFLNRMSNMEPDELQSRTVDWLRYPLMLLIVLLHTDTPLLYQLPQEGVSAICYYITRTLAKLAVPMFFIISGYYFFRKPDILNREAYLSKIRKRAVTLLVPYLFWNYFVWAFLLLVVVLQGHADWIPSDAFTPAKILDVVVGWGEGYDGMPKAFQLWFLRDLMIVCLLSPLLHLLLKGKWPVILLLFAAFYLMPWPNGWPPFFKRFPSALLFFSIGAYMGIHKQNMVEMARRVPLWLSVSVSTLLVAGVVWQRVTYGHFQLLFENLFSIAAVVPTVQIASTLVERFNLRPIKFISDSNFLLFVLHPIIMIYLVSVPLYGHVTNTPWHFWAVYSAEVLVPALFCIALYAIMSRLLPRTTSLLTGGRSGR